MKKRLVLRNKTVIAVCLMMILSLSACAGTRVGDYFAYCGQPFFVTVEGELDDRPIRADVYVDLTASLPEEIGLSVAYLAPESLKGVVVTKFADGSVSARLGDAEYENGDLGGLLTPFMTLCSEGEYASVQTDGKGRARVSFVNGDECLTYVFEHPGLPSALEGDYKGHRLSFLITEKK